MLRVQRILVKMLRDSLEEGYSVPSAIFNIKAGEKPESAREALEIDQAVAVIEQAAATLPHATRYLVSFIQGLRQGEALGLTWEALDFNARTITVDWQLQPLRTATRPTAAPASASPRTTRHGTSPAASTSCDPSPRPAPSHPDDAGDGRRTAGLPRDRPREPARARVGATQRLAYRQGSRRAGVPRPASRRRRPPPQRQALRWPRDARNTAAQILKELGVDEVTITAIMGHSSYLVSRGYMTSRMAEKRKAIEGAARMLSRPDRPLALDASGDTTDATPQ